MTDEVPWDEGIIGKLEAFFLKRYPIGKMWARSLGTFTTECALSDVELDDEYGVVTPNAWFLYSGRSGLAFKTPLLTRVRTIVQEFTPHVLAPSKFTPEGFTEWVCGKRYRNKKGEVKKAWVTEPHPIACIVRDEITKLIREQQKQYMANFFEYLSHLWDNFIEGYYTRKMGYEGNVKVFTPFISAGTELFWEYLSDYFFKQGLGCRILWIIEKEPRPERLSDDFFFSRDNPKDTEWLSLKRETVQGMRRLTDVKDVFVEKDARSIWIDFQHESALRACDKEGVMGSFEVKQPLNALKLAMAYSASRFSFRDVLLEIKKEDMRRAIEDVNIYTNMWVRAYKKWKWLEASYGLKEDREPSSKYDLLTFVGTGLSLGLFTSGDISGERDLTNLTKIGQKLALGVRKKVLEVVADKSDQSKLETAQFKRFKPARGAFPSVFRVTEKGKKWYEEEMPNEK